MLKRMEVLSLRSLAPLLAFSDSGAPATDPIQIVNVDGLGPVPASITTAPYAIFDGEAYQGASVGKRNIVLTLALNPDWVTQTPPDLRALLYAYFMPKDWVRLKFISTHLPDCYIDGYVETMEPGIFGRDPQYTVSIICPKPDFIAMDPTVITGVSDDGTDTTDIDYEGSVPAGFVFKVSPGADELVGGALAHTDLVFPGVGIQLVLDSEYPRQVFAAEGIVDIHDRFEMCTIHGKKYVRSILANGSIMNLLVTVSPKTQWPMLKPNSNTLSVITTPDAGYDWELTYSARFGGL